VRFSAKELRSVEIAKNLWGRPFVGKIAQKLRISARQKGGVETFI